MQWYLKEYKNLRQCKSKVFLMFHIHIIKAGLPLGAAYKIRAVLLLSPFGTDKN